MTPQERCDAIAKELYMGTSPDVWRLLAEHLIVAQIAEAEQEAYRKGVNERREWEASKLQAIKDEAFEAGATWMRDQCLEAYRHSGTSEEVENRICAIPVDGTDVVKRDTK